MRLFNRIFGFSLKWWKSLTLKPKPQAVFQIAVLASSMALFHQWKLQQMTSCMEDKNTYSARKRFSSAISEMRREFGQMAVYPQIKVSTQGNTYVIQFEIDQRKVDGIDVMSAFLETFKASSEFSIIGGSSLKENDVMTFNLEFLEMEEKFKTKHKGSVTITMVKDGDRPSSRFIVQKTDDLTPEDLKAILRAYKQAIMPRGETRKSAQFQQLSSNYSNTQRKKPENENTKKLTELGAVVFDPADKIANLDWDYLAGYERQKRDIEDTVLLALTHADIYDKITEGTRMKNEPNRPKAVLFEGPPGTGKTTSAKIIAQQVNIPLIYIPLEAIMSKFYGQSQKRLADLWEACSNLGRAIIFIDEIDALAGNRGSEIHEASRRILSTLLRKIDSFQSTTDVLLICATNRKSDIDPAMLSRIDLSIKFELPDSLSRAAIFKRYAKHLSDLDREKLSQMSQGFSGRNISDICKNAERRWASKLIRNEVKNILPDVEEYVQSLKSRKENQLDTMLM